MPLSYPSRWEGYDSLLSRQDSWDRSGRMMRGGCIVDKREWNKSNRLGGIRFFLYILLAIEFWMIIYLFFCFRYAGPLSRLGFMFPIPFFSVEDCWMDFINPIHYAWELDPYSAYWGNSPPFMMWIAYLLSWPIKIGIPEYFVYLIYYLLGISVSLYFFFRVSNKYGLNFGESLILSVTAIISFPYIYCFDRGNYVFLAAVAIIIFICAYDEERYFLAAFFLGIAAALKLYPALLGIVFLVDKKFKQAFFCAATGIVTSITPLFLFQGGFQRNLNIFLEKSGSYTKIGNGILGWLVDDKNSFYQLLLVPRMMGKTSLQDITQVPEYVASFKLCLTVLLMFIVLSCFFLKKKHDQFLILIMMMVGYPIESGVYNLVIAVFPIVYWCSQESENRIIPCLGGALVMMKSVFVLQFEPVYITLQAIANPLLELAIIIYIYYLRRKSLISNFNVH